MATGSNFETKRPRLDVLRDFRRVLHTAYTPEAYCRRIDRLVSLLDCSGRRRELPKGDMRRKMGPFNVVQEILRRMPEHRELFWRTFTKAVNTNPGALRAVVTLMGFYRAHRPVRALRRRADRSPDCSARERRLRAAAARAGGAGGSQSAPKAALPRSQRE